MELIFSDKVTSGNQAAFLANSIPGGFNSLLIKGKYRSDISNVADEVFVSFNGDTVDENYRGRRLFLESFYNTDNRNRQFGLALGATVASPQQFATSTATIIGYDSNNYKSYHILNDFIRSTGVNVNHSLNFYMPLAYMWADTSPITSISITCGVGNFVAGSSLAIYGLK